METCPLLPWTLHSDMTSQLECISPLNPSFYVSASSNLQCSQTAPGSRRLHSWLEGSSTTAIGDGEWRRILHSGANSGQPTYKRPTPVPSEMERVWGKLLGPRPRHSCPRQSLRVLQCTPWHPTADSFSSLPPPFFFFPFISIESAHVG